MKNPVTGFTIGNIFENSTLISIFKFQVSRRLTEPSAATYFIEMKIKVFINIEHESALPFHMKNDCSPQQPNSSQLHFFRSKIIV